MDAEKMEAKKQGKYNQGRVILILLAALTIGEFMIASIVSSMHGINLGSVLMLVALVKAFFVVRDYMHVGSLFSKEEEH